MTEFETHPPAYTETVPATGRRPFVFAVPHAGRHYPRDLLSASVLDTKTLRSSEDAYVDRLFDSVPDTGAVLIAATHARAYLDLNRDPRELDPRLIHGLKGRDDLMDSARVRAGLGLIPAVVGPDMPIYKGKLDIEDVLSRHDRLYMPYHKRLGSLLNACIAQWGRAYLIDCHSMPSTLEQNRTKPLGRKAIEADIVLGDCWGTSCDRSFTALAESLLTGEGFRVRRNIPYAGGFVTEHYGRPAAHIHALQIEINRGIYMDETTLEPKDCFWDIAARLSRFAAALMAAQDEGATHPHTKEYGRRLAAE